MNTEQFFDLVLPSRGFRCLAKPEERWFAHHILDTNSAAAQRVYWLNTTKSEEVYFACGSLKAQHIVKKNATGNDKKMRRVRENIALLKSFWLDIDCGANLKTGAPKDYPDQKAGLLALVNFLKQSGLPRPLIVNSGYGFHAYFILQQEISADQWVRIAVLLKATAKYFGLKVDDSRTADPCSILRPVGTHNRKDPENPKLVRPVPMNYDIIDVVQFAKSLAGLVKEHSILLQPVKVAAPASHLNSNFTSNIYGDTPTHAPPIADKCAAMAAMRDTQGNVEEPLWYSLIGILRYTVEAPQIIHNWSCGHPGYSAEETSTKIGQHEVQGAGPTTCQHIHDSTEAAPLCAQCPHFGNITSPIQLGRAPAEQTPAAPLPVELDETSDAPDAFAPKDIGCYELTPNGIYFKDSFEPGDKVEQEVKVLVLEYPLIIKTSAEDERKGGVIEVQCKHPNKGLHSFYMEKAVLAEKAAFNKELLRNHIVISAAKVDLMRDYAISYLQDLDRSAELQVLYSTMGWKGEDTFVLGDRCIRKGKPVENISLGMHLEGNYCSAIRNKGSLEAWAANTAVLSQPGMERHALSLLWGFGAPLLKFTGFSGATVNLWGRSNAGKSSMLHWLTSIYGEYDDLKAQKNDTYVSLMARLGSLKNLPLVLDEITNIDPKDVSDLIHDITQGREKARMTKNITDRKPRTWNTFALCSSNSTLTDKLLSAKDDPEAERLRLFEYMVPNIPEFEARLPKIHAVLAENQGVVGEYYIQYVVNNADKIKNVIDKIQKVLKKNTESLGKERFWIAAVSVALAGGYIAEKLGLIQFSVAKVQKVVEEMIKEMRGDMQSTQIEFSSVLGRYLNTHAQNVIFVKQGVFGGRETIEAVYEPTREMYIRVEHVSGGKRVYADKRHLLGWLQKKSVASSEFVRDTKKSGLLLDLNKKVVLGEGWPNNPNNAAVPTVMFFLPDAEEISRVVDTKHLKLVK